MSLAESRAQPGDEVVDNIRRLGMSPRQQDLNRRWAWYTATNYDACKVDWDGREVPDPTARDQIVSTAQLPAGFMDARNLPLKFRKPTAPYRLPRVITNRFTGLLFSERHHPEVIVEGDDDTQAYVSAMLEVARLWPRMIMARTYGGAQGSVVLGFCVVNGKPLVEVHDARWCTPTWKDRFQLVLASIEKRYQYPVEQRDPESGVWTEVPHWYRRVIDETSDTVWDPVPVENEEPDWDNLPNKIVEHKLGECPLVWVQNLPVEDDIDGECDCHGIYDMVESADQLISQSHKGTLLNLDPTLLLITKAKLAEVRKGSDNTIKIPEGSGEYLEIAGTGIKEAREVVREFRAYVLEVAQCVLEEEMGQKGGTATAFEIDRRYTPMLEKCDILREQYGQNGVLRLVEIMLRAARKLGKAITLGPRVIDKPDGSKETKEHKLGKGETIKLRWPKYFEPTFADTQAAVTAAAKAVLAGLIDLEHAARFVAEHFKVKDVPAMLKRIEKEMKDRQERLDSIALGGGGGGREGGDGGGGFR